MSYRPASLLEWFLIVSAIAILFLIVVAAITAGQEKTEKHCDEYANWTLETIPARCLKHFQ